MRVGQGPWDLYIRGAGRGGPGISIHIQQGEGALEIVYAWAGARGPWDLFTPGALGSVYAWGGPRGPWDQYARRAGLGDPGMCLRMGRGEDFLCTPGWLRIGRRLRRNGTKLCLGVLSALIARLSPRIMMIVSYILITL